MTARSFRRTGYTPARTFTSSVVALLGLVLCGCGVNLTPPQSADSGASDSGEQAGDMSIASTDGSYAGMESVGVPTEGYAGDEATGPGYEGSDPAMVDDEAIIGTEEDYAGADPLTDMHGADAGLAEVEGSSPEDLEAMRAEYEAQNAGQEGTAPEDLEAMRAQFDQEAGAGVAEGLDPADRGAVGEDGLGGGRGGSRAGQFEEGSAPYVVMLMVEAIDAGDLETAAKYISDDAKGLLASVRDGEAGENQVKELQSYFATMDPLSQRPRGRKITLNFNGGQSKVLSFDVVYEGREFLVDSLTIHDAQARRGR